MTKKSNINFKSFTTYERNVGIIMVFLFFTIISVLLYFYFQKTKIREPFFLYTELDSGLGIENRMLVLINGFECGYVDDVSINNKGKVRIRMLINKKYKNLIRLDSIAIVTNKSLIGETVINITVGSKDSQEISEGSLINGSIDKGLSEISDKIIPVISDLKEVTSKIITIADNMTRATESINSLVSSTQTVVDSINQKQGTVGMLIKDKSVYENVEIALQNLIKIEKEISDISQNTNIVIKDASHTIENFDSLIDTSDNTIKAYQKTSEDISNLVSKDISKMVNNLNVLIDSLKLLTGRLDVSTSNLPEIINQAQEGIYQIETVMEALKHSWLIRRYFTMEDIEGIIQYEER